MAHFSVDKKLELVDQVRSRYHRDQNDLVRREQILFHDFPEDEELEDEDAFSTLSLRAMIALGLFLWIIICDLSGNSFLGIQPSQCFQMISQDYESSITQWVNAASDNVKK